MIELFNLREGDSTFVPMAERRENFSVDYFTAEMGVTEDEAGEGIKRVILTFRKIAKDGGGRGLVAGMHHGKHVLFQMGEETKGNEILGVLVRTMFRYE